MRYALLADIHSNLHALEKTLEYIDEIRPDRLVCLGDVVGYGAYPSECISLIRERCDIVVAGNHDWGVCGEIELTWFNPDAQTAARWTRNLLAPEELKWLWDLPLTHEENGLFFVHSYPNHPNQWSYVRTAEDAKQALDESGLKTVFVAHSHLPFVYNDGKRLLVNVGSVGQPRDSDPRAGFCVYDSETRSAEIVRLPYPIPEAQEAIRKAGLPERLAKRLAMGW